LRTQCLCAGRVFSDNGSGGGIANDAEANGAEPGLTGSTVFLMNASGTITYSTTQPGASGEFMLLIPSGLPAGAPLQIVEVNPTGYVSTGAAVGNSGGVYTRSVDAITFTFDPGATYQGIAFANVPVNTLTTDGQQNGLPGTVVFYPHTFTAGSAGVVTFSLSRGAQPPLNGWSAALFRDGNGNGQFDPEEPQITGPGDRFRR
jgi:hypothetical protein